MRIRCLMEVTWKLGNTYLKIQDCESGWNFTILDLFIFINWCRIGRSNEIRYRYYETDFINVKCLQTLIARAFSGFPTWIKLYINSCNFLKNGPLCGLLTFDRSPNMVRRSACRNASFFLYRKDRLWCAAEFKNARTEAGMITRKSLDQKI